MRFPVWRRKQERELEEEIRSHLEIATRERMDRGESADHAEYSARRQFGNVGLVKDVTRRQWGWTRLEEFLQDLRYGARTLRNIVALGASLADAVRMLTLNPASLLGIEFKKGALRASASPMAASSSATVSSCAGSTH